MECSPEEIAWSQNEITETTKAYVGPLFPGIFTKLSNLEHIYTSFAEGKIRKSQLEIGGKTAQELENELIQQINPNAKIIQDPERMRPSKSEVFRLYGDNSKLMEATNWKPETSLAEGIKETIEWFRVPENLKSYKSNIYNI